MGVVESVDRVNLGVECRCRYRCRCWGCQSRWNLFGAPLMNRFPVGYGWSFGSHFDLRRSVRGSV